MKVGEIIRTTKLDAKVGKSTFGWKVNNPKRQRFVLVMLGIEENEGDINPDEVLNALGWKFED